MCANKLQGENACARGKYIYTPDSTTPLTSSGVVGVKQLT